MPFSKWITVKQYAKINSLHEVTVRRHIKNGSLRAEKRGHQYRIWQTEFDHPNERDYQAHHSFLTDILGSASMEVRRYIDSFPTVYGWSYRVDDPSNALRWNTVSGRPHVELHLAVEREYAWRYAYEHLRTGLPNTFAALTTATRSFAQYWQILRDLEDRHRAEVDELVAKEGHLVRIDDSRFFRSILSEVDKPQSTPSLDDYEVRTHRTEDSVVKVVSAADEELVHLWEKRHLQMRRTLIKNECAELHRLRSQVKMAAKQVADAISGIEVTGRLPGLCAICDPGRRTEET